MSKVEATVLELPRGDRLAWKFDYDPDLVAAGKTVPGARFKKDDDGSKFWHAPLTADNCLALRQAYGDELKIASPLADWYRAHAAEATEHAAASAATDANLLLVPTAAPRMAAILRPDQRAGISWIANPYRNAGLVADKPGLGKTVQVIGGIIEADIKGPILVTCPKIAVRNVWQTEIHKWSDERVYIARGTRAKREQAIQEFLEDPAERKWLIIVAEMLRVKRKPNETAVKANAKKRGRVEGYEYPDLFTQQWSVIIADESHKLLGSLTVAKSNLMGEGLAKLSQPPSGRRYAISGTPFGRGGRIHGMFGTLHWLWPDEFTSFWRWAERHFEIEEEFIGRGKTARKIVGLRGGVSGESFMASLGPRILRRTKEEVLKNLPPKQYVEVLCEMGPEQKRQYKQLGDEGEVQIKGGTLIANGVLAEITRARQIANGVLRKEGDRVVFDGDSCKMEALMEKLDARGILDNSGDTKVIISSRFNAYLDGVVLPALESAGVEYHLLTGATSERARDEAMDAFQKDGGAKVFVLNSKAGGVAVTLDAADEVHCMDELDNPEDNEQLEDRAHRASRNHQVTIFYYRTEGTYDVNVANNVEDKRQAQFEVLDGRRGIKDVRNWIKYDTEADKEN